MGADGYVAKRRPDELQRNVLAILVSCRGTAIKGSVEALANDGIGIATRLP